MKVAITLLFGVTLLVGSACSSFAIYLQEDVTTTNSQPKIVFERYVSSVPTDVIASGSLVQTNTWYHIVATYDGMALTLYLNGQKVGSTPDARVRTVKTASPFYVGGAAQDIYSLLATVDEVAVYDKALPDARVAEHYRVGSTGHPSRAPFGALGDRGCARA